MSEQGYGLVLSRSAGQSIVTLGAGKLQFLDGQFEAVIVSPIGCIPIVQDQSVTLDAESMLIITGGRAKISIVADPDVKILRGELLGSVFRRNPFFAAIGNVAWTSDLEFEARSKAYCISHVRRVQKGSLCPAAA